MSVHHLRTASRLAAALAAAIFGGQALAQSAFISEYVEGSSNNKAIELYNPGSEAINLGAEGYVLQFHFNGNANAGLSINLSGSVAPGATFVIAHGSADAAVRNLAQQINSSSWYNGDDAIVLRRAGVVVDSLGQVGVDPGTEWGSGLVSTADNTLRRKASICAGDSVIDDAFDASQWDGYANNSFDGLGQHPSDCGGAQPTALTLSAAASPASLIGGETTLLTATVVPGTNPSSSEILVLADLGGLGGLPGQPMFDDGSHGDAIAGDLVFSLQATVPANLSGNRSVLIQARDGQNREAAIAVDLSIVSLVGIHAIQGSGEASPLVGQVVATEGVVTAVKSNGYFIQSADHEVDGDPQTSEGVFVFTGSSAKPAAVAVGNRVRVQGTVVEYVAAAGSLPLTELTATTVSLLASGQPLPAMVELSAELLAPGAARDVLEHLEGMRAFAASLDVVAPTLGSINEKFASSTGNGVFYSVLAGVPRPFREPGLSASELGLGAPANTPRFDGNAELLRIDSGALGGERLILDVGARLDAVSGIVDYAFNTWTLLPEPGFAVTAGAQPQPARQAGEHDFTVAGFNLLRFFDDLNDPSIGEPVLTADAYAFRLAKTAAAICDYLHAPDILGVVEVESLPVLNRLAAEINANCPAAPQYVAVLEEGNDVGGIDIGFLVSQREIAAGLPRVSIEAVAQIGADTLWTEPSGSSDLLNDRPSLMLEATVFHANGHGYPLTVVANHLRSLGGANAADASGERVRAKRAAQALQLAQWVEARQQANPDEAIMLIGDFNAFEFNDGLVDSMGILTGNAAAADAVLLHVASPVSRALRIVSAEGEASHRYSYSFDGNAQSLDHLVANQALLDQVNLEVDHARINADFSKARFGDAGSDAYVSDHDPVLAVLSVPGFRSADLSLQMTGPRTPIITGRGADFVIDIANAGPDAAPAARLQIAANAPASALQITAPAGWSCVVVSSVASSSRIDCANDAEFANADAARFTLRANPPRNFPRSWFELDAEIGAGSTDAAMENNRASARQRIAGVPGFGG